MATSINWNLLLVEGRRCASIKRKGRGVSGLDYLRKPWLVALDRIPHGAPTPDHGDRLPAR
jgi:hypothetical protein